MPRARIKVTGRRLVVLLCLVLSTALLPAPAAVGTPTGPWLQAAKGYTGDFPDPSVLRVGGTYYAYATNTGGALLPVSTSTDLRTWTAPRDALVSAARWGAAVGTGHLSKELWAPSVFAYHGRYIAYYALRKQVSPRRTCISVAIASAPSGPFTDTTTSPVVCDADPLGSIDPRPFLDPATGLPYLVWKSEGQAGVRPTRLWAQRLDSTGTRLLTGSPRRLLLQTAQAWEGHIIENPSMVRYGRHWWLFYSANGWESPSYAVGYAHCSGPLGPCTRASVGPLLRSSGSQLGPGGADAFLDGAGRLRLVLHFWTAPHTSYPLGARRMGVTRLFLDPTGHLSVAPVG